MASTLLGEPSGTTPLATAAPIILRDKPVLPAVAAVAATEDLPAQPGRTLSRLCLDNTFYGTVETPCAWGRD